MTDQTIQTPSTMSPHSASNEEISPNMAAARKAFHQKVENGDIPMGPILGGRDEDAYNASLSQPQQLVPLTTPQKEEPTVSVGRPR